MKFKQKQVELTPKNVCIIIIIILIALYIISAIVLYFGNDNFSKIIDKKVFKKIVTDENINYISINSNNNIYGYDKYIVVLEKNNLVGYSHLAKKDYELNVNINTPIFESNDRYLCVAEKGGKKIYLIDGNNIAWQRDIEGEIIKVSVSENGYISVIVSQTSYRTVVITLNSKGEELFTRYLSTTIATDTEISNDNKYLAIAETNISGTLVQSYVEIISLEKALNEPENSIIYTYTSEPDKAIINIEYQDKNKLVCMYDTEVKVLDNNLDELLTDIKNEDKILFLDVNLKNYALKIQEKSEELFSTLVEVKTYNIESKKQFIYNLNYVPKNVYTYNNLIALNLGTEVYFVNTNGWLVKHYTSSKEINRIIFAKNVVGIVYKDKIEFMSI